MLPTVGVRVGWIIQNAQSVFSRLRLGLRRVRLGVWSPARSAATRDASTCCIRILGIRPLHESLWGIGNERHCQVDGARGLSRNNSIMLPCGVLKITGTEGTSCREEIGPRRSTSRGQETQDWPSAGPTQQSEARRCGTRQDEGWWIYFGYVVVESTESC